MISKSYKKYIIEGKGLLAFAIFFSIITRVAYFFLNYDTPVQTDGGYLWNLISPILEEPIYSLLGGALAVAAIALSVAYINNKYSFIRRRTLLPPAIALLLFSCHPSFFRISGDYLAALALLMVINIFFNSANERYRQQTAFNTGFFLAVGCLFSPLLIVYILPIWIGLILVNKLHFKSLLATLFGFFILYAPIVTYILLTGDQSQLEKLILQIDSDTLANLPIYNYNIRDYIILGFSILLLSILFTNNFVNSYKDKIRVRTYIRFLGLIALISLLLFLFANIFPLTNLYISYIIASFFLAHFFALNEEKWVVYLFYTCSFFYIFVVYYFFLG